MRVNLQHHTYHNSSLRAQCSVECLITHHLPSFFGCPVKYTFLPWCHLKYALGRQQNPFKTIKHKAPLVRTLSGQIPKSHIVMYEKQMRHLQEMKEMSTNG